MTGDLTALALLALGAGEAIVGGQRFLLYAVILVQLLVLRQVGHVPKRTLLVAGQAIALVASVPLLAFASFGELGPAGVWVTVACFTLAGAGFAVNSTVWFPLLHGYVSPERTGQFFGILRTGWHLTLIPFFLGSRAWLEARPGDFGPLFAVAIACGVVRLFLIARLPERSERTGEPVRLGEAFRSMRARPGWRAYFLGTTSAAAARTVFLTFSVVLMRRELGFSEGEVLYTTVAIFAGGLTSLYLSGRWVDRLGPGPIFRWTTLSQVLVIGSFTFLMASGRLDVALAVGLFFAFALLVAAFDLADTRVLFSLARSDSPARLIVPTTLLRAGATGVFPLAVGFGIEGLLAAGSGRAAAYGFTFALVIVALGAAYGPLRRLGANASTTGG